MTNEKCAIIGCESEKKRL